MLKASGSVPMGEKFALVWGVSFSAKGVLTVTADVKRVKGGKRAR